MAHSSNNKPEHPVAIGVGLAALAAAAAGAYYLYGTDKGKKRRAHLKSWMLRMKADVMEEIENLKDLNEEMYKTTIAKISDKYKKLKDIDPQEVTALAMRMHSHWKDIQKDINQTSLTNGKKKRTSKAKKGSKKKTS